MAIQGVSGDSQQGVLPSTGQGYRNRLLTPYEESQPRNLTSPYSVTISPVAWERLKNSANNSGDVQSADSAKSGAAALGPQECQTCKNRKYVDRSNDATVSFQSPTRLSPGAAETAVRAHEQEHVSNEQQKADEQGRKVVSQTVAIHYAICPECGRSYVAGGTTTTVTRAESNPVASKNRSSGKGIDLTV